jgi:hypothetical protein
VLFLVDSGSSISILSRTAYERTDSFPLTKFNAKINSVTGTSLTTYGWAEVDIHIGGLPYHQRVVVADIEHDAILGQDFLLKHVTGINYLLYTMQTRSGTIQCWMGEEAESVSTVTVREHVEVHPETVRQISVDIEGSSHLTPLGIVEPTSVSGQCNQEMMLDAIDLHSDESLVEERNPEALNVNMEINSLITQEELSCDPLVDLSTSFTEEDTSKKVKVNIRNQRNEFLPQVVMAYRASQQTSTHMSPNMMVLGREISLPCSAVIPRPDDVAHTLSRETESYLQELKTGLQPAHEVARTNRKKSAVYQKKQYDVKPTRRSLRKGQAVWLHHPTRTKGVCHKRTSKWKGQYVISRKIDDTTYRVRKSKNQLPEAYHMDRLQPYCGQKLPKWMLEQTSK